MTRKAKINLVIILACAAVAAAMMSYEKAGPVESKGRPVRIVTASPQITEIAYAMGLENRIAAVTSDADYPPAASQKPMIGKFWQLNMEAMIAARADLVIIENFEQQKSIGRRMEQMGYPVLTVSMTNFEELFETIKKIGQATESEVAAQMLVDSIKSKLINLSGQFQCRPKRSVLWVMQTEPVRVAGVDTFPNEFIELAGGRNAIGKTVQKYPPIGAEQIVASAPEIIIQPAMSSASVEAERKAAVKFWSNYPNIPAVKNGRVYVIAAETVHRLTPRLPEGLELVGRCIHPEIFDANLADTNSIRIIDADANDANN